MATRTCQSSEDLKQIWRLLLPDAPFPACAPAGNSAVEPSESETSKRADRKPPANSGAR